MRHIVIAHTPPATLSIERVLHGAATPLPALGAVVQQLGPCVECAELQAGGKPSIHSGLEGMVNTLPYRNVPPINALILREKPERLGDDTRETWIRRRDSGDHGFGRIDVSLQ